MSTTQKLTLQQAMETLKNMFPTISHEVLKTNLYRANGRMEDTIEALLRIQSATPPPPRRPDDDNVPHSLPPDFLRYDLEESGARPNQVASDEQLAVRLQRQMILEDLHDEAPPLQQYHRSQEQHVRQRAPNAVEPSPSPQRPMASAGIASRGAPQQQPSALDSVAEKLSGLSSLAKKKFAEFQQRFGGGNSSGAQSGASNASTHKPLAGNGPEYSSLLHARDDDDDDEQSPSSFYDNKKL